MNRKVIVTVRGNGGKLVGDKIVGVKEVEIPIPEGLSQQETDKQLKEIEDRANKKYKKMHLPMVCEMSFTPAGTSI